MYRFGLSTEDICISKINAGIRAIKLGTKTPEEANVGYFLNKLKAFNEGMYQELLTKYMVVLKKWKETNLDQ